MGSKLQPPLIIDARLFFNLPFWHDSWQEFTEEEKNAVSDAMKVFVEHQIDQTLKHLKLHAP